MRRDIIGEKLAPCVLRHLVDGEKDIRVRLIVSGPRLNGMISDVLQAAQLLSVVLHEHHVARAAIISSADWYATQLWKSVTDTQPAAS